MSALPPDAYAGILQELNKKGITPIIVGGQAVNIWASIFTGWDSINNPEPHPLRDLIPFTSSDMDLAGVLNHQISYLPGIVERDIPVRPFRSLAKSTGFFVFRDGSALHPLRVQLMKSVLGTDDQELRERSLLLEFAGSRILVPDPIVILKCKLANLSTLPQAERSDLSHVKIMVRCVRAYIGQDVQQGVEARHLLRMIDRLNLVRQDRDAKAVESKFEIDLSKCLPVPELIDRARTDEKIMNYVRYQLGR
jgi:hypothetical protein